MTDQGMKRRLRAGAFFPALALAGMGVRLAFLHLGPHEGARDAFVRSRTVQRQVLARRGSIFDCRGERNLLALNLAAKDVCADPRVIIAGKQVASVTTQLAGALGVRRADLVRRIAGDDRRRFAYVERYVPEEEAEKIEARRLPGVFFQDTCVRHYPQRAFLCHVLGFVDYGGVGRAGVEQFMDCYLRGSPGMLEGEVNALRQELRAKRQRDIPALRGADVFLTIDQNVQHIVERALDDAVREQRAKGAWAIVQRVRTGEILAMASRPAYDPNEFRTTEPLSRLNRAIGCVYEPGSTLKAATISAALNEGTVSPATVFDCESGAWSYAQRVLHDVHPYGPLTVADGVKKSSNILTAKVALTLGPERLHRYLRAFGLGAPLRVDLPGEEAGIVRPLRTWSAVDPTRIAIGQGVSVTALQMLGVICAIANDGVLMRPYVVSSVSRADGGALLRRGPEVLSRPIRPDTAAVMRGLLARVTEDGGTGTKARVEGYEVAGKTGTAQKPVNGVYGDECVASFVGFLPARSPRIAAIVVVDEPQAERMGGAVAAPLFSRIAGEAVRCLDIPPDPRNAVVVARARPRGGPEEP